MKTTAHNFWKPVARSRILWSVVICVVLGFLLISAFPIISHTSYVNFATGKNKHCTSVLGITVSSTIEETDFSKHLSNLASSGSPQWVIYRSNSYAQPVSPHYTYHGIPTVLDSIVVICQLQEMKEPEIAVICNKAIGYLSNRQPEQFQQLLSEIEDEWRLSL